MTLTIHLILFEAMFSFQSNIRFPGFQDSTFNYSAYTHSPSLDHTISHAHLFSRRPVVTLYSAVYVQ